MVVEPSTVKPIIETPGIIQSAEKRHKAVATGCRCKKGCTNQCGCKRGSQHCSFWCNCNTTTCQNRTTYDAESKCKIQVLLWYTETTGLHLSDELIEVYLQSFDSSESFHSLIRPKHHQTTYAGSKLTYNDLQKAPTPAKVIPEMMKWIASKTDGTEFVVFVAHNGSENQLDHRFQLALRKFSHHNQTAFAK